MRLTRRNRLVLFAPAAVLLTGWLVMPAVLGLFATFTTYAPFGATVRFSGLYNYAAVLRDSEFRAAVSNIAVFTIVAVPLELVFLLPLVWTALAALGLRANNNTRPPSWVGSPTLDHFRDVGVAEPSFWQELATSMLSAACAATLTVAASLPAAYGLARSHFRGDRVLTQGFLVLASLPRHGLRDSVERSHASCSTGRYVRVRGPD